MIPGTPLGDDDEEARSASYRLRAAILRRDQSLSIQWRNGTECVWFSICLVGVRESPANA
jgi:hypothetical protein